MNTTQLPHKKHHISYANNHIELVGSIQENKANNTIVAKGTIESNNDIAMLGVLGHVLDKGYALRALRYHKQTGCLFIEATKKKQVKPTITETLNKVEMLS